MPALAAVARQAAVFEWAFSPGNVTRRSLPSMMTGLSAPRLRGRVAGWALKLDPRHVLLAERLRAAGYDTAGYFCCTSQFGAEHKLGLTRGIRHVVIDKDSGELARRAASWLAGREQRVQAGKPRQPLFVWFHFIEPHGWERTQRPSAEARRYKERYDLSLADVDSSIGLVVDAFWNQPGRRQQTFLILTSDHGEGLGDHGHRAHAASLYNSEIRVPLVVVGPGIPASRIARPVGLHDLTPSLLDLAGFVAPGMPQMDGASFAPVLRGDAPADLESGEAYAAMIRDRSVSIEKRAVVVGRHKLLWRPGRKEVELYDIAKDPHETEDLADREPELARRMRKRLAERRAVDSTAPF
jgi:arylsulfatase A-like enzyme